MLDAHTIAGFSRSVLSARFDNPRPTPAFHEEVWELCCSDHRYVAIAAPRGHAKSTCVTHGYLLAALLFREHSFALIVSDTEGQAADFLNNVRVEVTENEDLIALFGIARIVKDTQTELIVQMDDGHRWRIIAKGSEQKVRGLLWHGKRPDLIVGDDLENDEIVLNKDRRDKFKKWVFGALLPALSDTGKARFVGTILHMDSFLECQMPNEKDPLCVRTNLSVKLSKSGETWGAARYAAHAPNYERILWPGKFTKQRLEAIRNDYVVRGFPEVYAQEYLNVPIDESSAFFRRVDFIPRTIEDKALRLRYYAAVDFAITEQQRSDYTVIVVAGIDLHGFLHVVDVRRGRWDALQIIQEMFSVQARYQPDLFTVEAGMIEKALGPFLKAEMFKQGQFLNLNPLVPTKDKKSRASSIQARMRAGGVKFDTEAEWYPDLQQEMLRFPRDVHDDQVDALSWVGLTLTQIAEPPTDRELEDEYYDELEREEPHGRSVMTGY